MSAQAQYVAYAGVAKECIRACSKKLGNSPNLRVVKHELGSSHIQKVSVQQFWQGHHRMQEFRHMVRMYSACMVVVWF